MKTKIVLLFATLFLMTLVTACGGDAQPAAGADSPNPASTSGSQSETSQSSISEEFLKSITPESAEYKGVCGADLTWYYQDNVLVIRGTGPMNTYRAGAPWDTVLPGHELSGKINWVVFEEGVTTVTQDAFQFLSFLSRVELVDSITHIETGAFDSAPALTSIKLPSQLEYIDFYAFGSEVFRDQIVELPASLKEVAGGTGLDNVAGLRFLGDAPQMRNMADPDIEIYYRGEGFEVWMEEYPHNNWIKE